MKKIVYILTIIFALTGCKYYSETLTFNDDWTSGKMAVSASYNVTEAQKRGIERPTGESLKKKLEQFDGINVSLSTVHYSSEYNRDYVDVDFTFESEKAFNALGEGKGGFGPAGVMVVSFNLDEWRIEYNRIITLDPHDEADYTFIIPEGMYVLDTNADDVDDDAVSWYFNVGDNQLKTELFLFLAEK